MLLINPPALPPGCSVRRRPGGRARLDEGVVAGREQRFEHLAGGGTLAPRRPRTARLAAAGASQQLPHLGALAGIGDAGRAGAPSRARPSGARWWQERAVPARPCPPAGLALLQRRLGRRRAREWLPATSPRRRLRGTSSAVAREPGRRGATWRQDRRSGLATGPLAGGRHRARRRRPARRRAPLLGPPVGPAGCPQGPFQPAAGQRNRALSGTLATSS